MWDGRNRRGERNGWNCAPMEWVGSGWAGGGAIRLDYAADFRDGARCSKLWASLEKAAENETDEGNRGKHTEQRVAHLRLRCLLFIRPYLGFFEESSFAGWKPTPR